MQQSVIKGDADKSSVIWKDLLQVISLKKVQLQTVLPNANSLGKIYLFLVGRVFANGPGDLGSIPGCGIPKTLKMILDTFLVNTQQYKVCIKGKLEQSRERSSTLPYTSVK